MTIGSPSILYRSRHWRQSAWAVFYAYVSVPRLEVHPSNCAGQGKASEGDDEDHGAAASGDRLVVVCDNGDPDAHYIDRCQHYCVAGSVYVQQPLASLPVRADVQHVHCDLVLSLVGFLQQV